MLILGVCGQLQQVLLSRGVLGISRIEANDGSGLEVGAGLDGKLFIGDEPPDAFAARRRCKRASVSKPLSAGYSLLVVVCHYSRLKRSRGQELDKLRHGQRLRVSGCARGRNLIDRPQNCFKNSGWCGCTLPRLQGPLSSAASAVVALGRSRSSTVVQVDVNTDDSNFLLRSLPHHVHLHGHACTVVKMLAGQVEVELLELVGLFADLEAATAGLLGDHLDGGAEILKFGALGKVGDFEGHLGCRDEVERALGHVDWRLVLARGARGVGSRVERVPVDRALTRVRIL